MEKIRSVLVMHAQPERIAAVVEAGAEDVSFHYADRPDCVAPMLETVQPDAVFGIVQAGFSGTAQRPAAMAASVRWFQIGGVGYDHIGRWDPGRLVVTNCGGLLAPFLAETMTGAMLALNGHFPAYWRQQQQRVWRQHPFRPLRDCTLLVVGAGAIGTCVARNGKALGMRVWSVSRTGSASDAADATFRVDELDELLPRADVVSVHVTLNDSSRRLFDRRRLSLLRPDALFMNASRGEVIEETALVEALGERRIRAAYLDVFEREPLPPESPLWTLDNVMITPHASDSVSDWQERFAERFAENLRRWNADEPLLGRLSP